MYNGSVESCPHFFDLDDHHRFVTGKPMLVCGNTAAMISETRYASAFTVFGDRSVHYGAFDCGGNAPADARCDSGSCCC